MKRRDALWVLFWVAVLILVAVGTALMLTNWMTFIPGNTTAATNQSPLSSRSTDGVSLPKASVTIGNQHLQTVINGYQWSHGNKTSIGDAASDPAKHLREYTVMASEQATIQFSQKPTNAALTIWSHGHQPSKVSIRNSAFTLPVQVGTYNYEIAGQWGNDYVNYDFEVHVRP